MASSSRRFQSWQEALILENPKCDETIEKEKHGSLESILKRQDGIFLAKQSEEQGGITFLHHFSKLQKKDKTTSYVALAGLSSEATPLELDVNEVLQELEVKVPRENMSSIGGKEQESRNLTPPTCTVCQIQLVPPDLISSLLTAEDKSPLGLLARAKESIQQNTPLTDSDLCQSAIAYIACVAQKSPLQELGASPSSSPEVLEWSRKLHEAFIEPKAELPTLEGTKSKVQRLGTENRKQRSWDESYALLVQYMTEHGDCNVPREYKADRALGEWCKNQRAIQKTLSKDRRAKLESIGFTFSNTQQDRSNRIWESYFEKLQKYVNVHGDCKSFSKQDSKEDRALQHWVSVQRQAYKRGAMSEGRIKKLELIGFVWKLKNNYKPRTPKDEVWIKGYEKLVEFHKLHSHVNVPKRPKSARPLWEWVRTQKRLYNEQRLCQDKVELMEKLGMAWERDNGQAMRDQQWDSKHKEAAAFHQLHGHLEIPRGGIYGNSNLLKWLGRQREQYKNDKLSESRIKMLRVLDFDFEGNTKSREKQLEKLAWKEAYGELLAYHKAHGSTCILKNGTAKEKRLEKWIAKQRVAGQCGDLDPARKELLIKLKVEFGTEGKRSQGDSQGEKAKSPDEVTKNAEAREVSASKAASATSKESRLGCGAVGQKPPPLLGERESILNSEANKTAKGRKRRSQESNADKKKLKTDNSVAVVV